jgi:hypothetical protein
MKELTTALDELLKFLMGNPTLSHQRRALGTNGRLASVETVDDWIGEKLSKAGESTLRQIHNEIFNGLPEDKKEEVLSELKGDDHRTLGLVVIPAKPELTPEYLKSIGRPDIMEWGTD